MADIRIVIPARYGSTRLPGKPLRLIAGRPMIQHVWDNAMQAGASQVLVATDDSRIADAVTGFGGEVVMTDPNHASGTDRLAEVAEKAGFPGDTIVVNLQGDEPGMPPALLTQVADALASHPRAGISTLATPITEVDELFNPNVVKVVLDDGGMAQYFSRAPIPWVRDVFADGPPMSLPEGVPFLRHLGLYAYRAETLLRLSRADVAVAERAEALEQLRALALGVKIHVSLASEEPGCGVDTEGDLRRLQEELAGRGVFRSNRGAAL